MDEGQRMKDFHRLFVYLFLIPAVALIMAYASDMDGSASDKTPNPGSSKDEFACFVYHRFGDGRYPSTNISIDTFRSHLEFLQKEEYTVYTLGEAIQRLQLAGGVPEKTVVLTVDDGYKSFFTGAMPLLREGGFKVTLFINSSNVGNRDHLGWNELKKLMAEGIEIGNHSATHPHFLNVDKEVLLSRFKEDVKKAQKEIEAHLGVEPEVFSYPFGEYNLEMKRAVKELGFKAAAAQNSGIVHRSSNLYAIPRFPMGGPYATLDGFREKIGMSALKVRKQIPPSPVLKGPNPPELKLILDSKDLNLNGLQCFIQGKSNCTIRKDPTDPNTIMVKAKDPLKERRALYTITAPSMDGKTWHWFSHLWIQPEIEE